MALVLNSNQIMSMACGKSPTDGLVQLFGDRDFSSAKAITEKLKGRDIVDSLAALVCVVVQLELDESQSKFSVQPENGKFQILDIEGCSGWNGFVALLKTKPESFVNVTFGGSTKVEDTDTLDQPNFTKAGLSEQNTVSLVTLQSNGVTNFASNLFLSNNKEVGYVIICEAGESAFAISSIKSATKTIINRSAPAAKIKKLSDINPRVLAKTVADILTKIDTESKDSPNRQAVLRGAASNLAKDVREMSAALSSDPNSEFFGKSSQQIASIVTAKFLPQFGKEFAAIPNELSLEIDETLRIFRGNILEAVKLDDSTEKTDIVNRLREQSDILASSLNEASLFLNISEPAINHYGFKTVNGNIEFSLNDSQGNPITLRENGLPAIGTVFTWAAVVLSAITIFYIAWQQYKKEEKKDEIQIKFVKLAQDEAKKAKVCTLDSSSQACKQATAEANATAAEIKVLQEGLKAYSDDSILGSLANKLQEFSNSLAPMLKVIGWTVAGAVAVVAAKKIYNALKDE